MKPWDQMTSAEQDELYPIGLAVAWCIAVGGMFIVAFVGFVLLILGLVT